MPTIKMNQAGRQPTERNNPLPGLTKYVGYAALILAAALWASTFVIVKGMVQGIAPATVNFFRFGFAFVSLAPFALASKARGNRRMWRAGAELGVWLFASYGCQTIGLNFTSPNRSAFITAMSVLFVPMLSAALGTRIPRKVWLAAALAFVGCGLMSYDGSPPNRGDLWTLITAIVYAIYILRLEASSSLFPAAPFAVAQLVSMVILSGLWSAARGISMKGLPWLELAFLGVFTTGFTTLLQAIGQKTVPGARAAIILTLEPVFAAIFTFLVLGQLLGTRGMIGGALIITGAIISQTGQRPSKTSPVTTPEPSVGRSE